MAASIDLCDERSAHARVEVYLDAASGCLELAEKGTDNSIGSIEYAGERILTAKDAKEIAKCAKLFFAPLACTLSAPCG